jgi:hypothetical protein
MFSTVCVTLFKSELNLLKKTYLNSVSIRYLYSSRPNSYIVTRAPTCGPEVVGILLQD